MLLLLLAACGTDVSVSPGKTDNDGDGYTAEVDCDDAHATVNPDAAEVCDGVDQDCDGATDEDATDAATWYADSDGDTFGDPTASTTACDLPSGYVADASDCDDDRVDVHPGAPEVCDEADQDCDGATDEDATDAPTWYADSDGDTYGDDTSPVVACDAPAGTLPSGGDCEDHDAAVHPGAEEICDDIDQDCDGIIDDGATDAPLWYTDADGDGYGGDTAVAQCDAPPGATASPTDCDDTLAAIHPGATEVCDEANVDEDCDGLADDGDTAATGKTRWYRDADADTFGSAATSTTACDLPSGYVADASDCDDADATVSPAAAEVCDPADSDEDCDGLADDADGSVTGTTAWYTDGDGDGYAGPGTVSVCTAPAGASTSLSDCDDTDPTVSPAGAEVCDDGLDQDCDGVDDVCGGLGGTMDIDVGYTTKIYGEATNDFFGIEVIAGDFNGDGAGDLVVDAAANTYGGEKGTIYGYYGPFEAGASSATTHADLLLYSTAHHPESGLNTDYGYLMGNLGDINGDGSDDLWAYRFYEPGIVYYGGDAGFTADLSYADGTAACNDAGAAGDVYPATSTPEWVCSDSGYASGSGRAFVYTAPTTQVAELTAEAVGDFAGAGFAGAGDVDGDGVDDLWIGAPSNTGNQGAAYLLSGPVSGTRALSSADEKILGTAAYEGLGWDIRAPGDVDGDGYHDVFLGAPWESTGGTYAGAIYLVTNPTTGDIESVAAAKVTGTQDSESIGADDFEVGDINGDGNPDLLASGPFNDDGAIDGGSLWLVYGPMSGTLSLASADAQWVGSDASTYVGLNNVAIVPDTNGDGADEVAVGGRAANEGSYLDRGAVWVWLGER